jgi:cytochrome-b5 reductase
VHTHNTDLFVFALKDSQASAALPVSSCVMTRCQGADGADVLRPYTPVHQHERGVLQLLIKRYEAGVMSKHIHSLEVGDTLDIKGPFPKLKYEANKWKHVGMVAGGTGQYGRQQAGRITHCRSSLLRRVSL